MPTMKRIAQGAGAVALLLVCAPPAAAQLPASPEPDPPDCEAWKSYGFYRLFPDADADADAVRFLPPGRCGCERTRR